MKPGFAVAAAVIVLFAGCTRRDGADDARVIRVNGTWIQRSDVETVEEMMRKEMASRRGQPRLLGSVEQIRKGAARQVVANELMIQRAREEGIPVSDSSVDRAVASLKSAMGEERFEEQLAKSGQDEQMLRRDVRESLMVDSLVTRVISRAGPATDAECREFYDQHRERFMQPGRIRARQILILVNKGMSSDEVSRRKEKAQDLLEKLRKGTDFGALAKTHSEGPNAARGGDIGWFRDGDMIPEIEKSVRALSKGAVSGIVESSVGLHILQRTDDEPSRVQSYEEALSTVQAGLKLQERAMLINSYIDSLIGLAAIEYTDTSFAPVGM